MSAQSLVIIPEQDYIVPPDSAAPLGVALPRAEFRVVPTSPIGMAVGAYAKTVLYDPLADWLVQAIS